MKSGMFTKTDPTLASILLFCLVFKEAKMLKIFAKKAKMGSNKGPVQSYKTTA